MILSILKLSVNSMRLGARYQAIAIYSKRFVNWFLTNTPYLSGDGFSLLADYNYRAPKYWGLVRRRKKIVMARTVFCPSHYLEDFLENHFSEIRCETLILGNSDRNFSDFDSNCLPQYLRSSFKISISREMACDCSLLGLRIDALVEMALHTSIKTRSLGTRS